MRSGSCSVHFDMLTQTLVMEKRMMMECNERKPKIDDMINQPLLKDLGH